MTPEQVHKLADGVDLDEGRTAPAKVRVVHETERNTHITITIHEGRYRQVRRMCEAVNLMVASLKRTRYGLLELGDLKPGEYRRLTVQEVKSVA